jgi:hypothetical protein
MPKRTLHISRELSLPLDLVTQRTSILGRTRSGKSHTAGVIVEEVLKARQQVVILDPKGDWWGLRSSADGKAAGLQITIMGGKHGDIPLEPTAGAFIADVVVKERISVVLDLSLFESKADEIRFVTAFLDRFYRKNTEPVLLVIDESDNFAPQRPERNETVMLNRMETICRRGAGRGIGVILVSQRSASLHKGCLSQTELMIAHQTTAPQDKEAIEKWVVAHGDEAQHESFMKRIPRLPIGTAIVWSPSWLDIYQEVGVRSKETYDSSAAPRIGKRRRPPKVLAQVDLERLKKHMAETIEKAKLEDPALLKAEVARLRIEASRNTMENRELQTRIQKMTRSGPTVDGVKLVPGPSIGWKEVIKEIPVVPPKDLHRLERVLARFKKLGGELARAEGTFRGFSDKLHAKVEDVDRKAKAAKTQGVFTREPSSERVLPDGRSLPFKPGAMTKRDEKFLGKPFPPGATSIEWTAGPKGEVKLRAGEKAILQALWRLGGTAPCAQVGTLAGFPASGSTFVTYLGVLKRNKLIATTGDLLDITELGQSFVPDPSKTKPQTTDDLVAMWRQRLRAGEKKILDVLVQKKGEWIAYHALPVQAGIEKETTYVTYLGVLKRNGLAETKGNDGETWIRASRTLFPST